MVEVQWGFMLTALLVAVSSVFIQAWVPPAGNGSVTFIYQRIDNTGRLRSDGTLGPNVNTTNLGLYVEGEYAFTDRFSVIPATAGRLVAAGSDTTRTITAILIEFVHQCTPSQRDALEAIVNNPAVTTQERFLARALLNVEHTPNSDDKPQLLALTQDKSASAADRTLASVIYNLVHTATDADKERLRRLKN